MSNDAVSLIQERLRSIAAAYGYPQARISLFPTLLIVALGNGDPAIVGTIDTMVVRASRALRDRSRSHG